MSLRIDRDHLFVLALAMGLLSCDDEAGPPPVEVKDAAAPIPYDASVAFDDGGIIVAPPSDGPIAFDRSQVLANFAACNRFTIGEFHPRAVALESATAALIAHPGADAQTAARAAYREAMRAWQVVEAMQVGPTATAAQPGGQGLRNEIYAWPIERRCDVEKQIIAKGYESPTFGQSLVTQRGLSALEYLLFYDGVDTACTDAPTVQAWSTLSADERAARKRAYAARAAAEVNRRAQQLATAWDPAGGGFERTLATAGPGNATYPTTQAAFNSVSDGLFYVESDVKDMKIAKPLGLGECMDAPCLNPLESPYAALSKDNVRANLVGFRRLFEGCGAGFAGLGFDDLLTAIGAGATANAVLQGLAGANAALEAIEEPDLGTAVVTDKPSVRAFYDALTVVTRLLKADVMTALDLELPASVEGDND